MGEFTSNKEFARRIEKTTDCAISGKDPTDFDALASEVLADPVASKAAQARSEETSTRRNGTKNSGFINWPVHMKNTGEGGMFVLAVVLDLSYHPHHPNRDSFINCHGPGFSLPHQECLVGIHPAPPIDFVVKTVNEDVTPNLLACITLGTSDGSWYDEENEELWSCGAVDLTPKGRDLINALSRLYDNRTVYLLTYLDT